MSAPRPTQFIALKRLAAGSRRHLHMTGPATFPSALLTGERSASNLPRDIAGLRAECKRRRIDFSGSTQDLQSRLSADDMAHSRAFTTAIESSKRPSAEQLKDGTEVVRHFNTSRTLKAVNDSSTIDFAFLPDFDLETVEATAIRVPLLHNNFSPTRTGVHGVEAADNAVIKPVISTVSADTVISTMSEISDNNAAPIDFHAVADRVATFSKKAQAPATEQSSMLKQLWSGIVEDFRGPSKHSVA